MELRAIEWYDTPYAYDSANGRQSLDNLKERVPNCNAIGLNMNVTTQSETNVYVSSEERSKIDYAISYARTKGYKITVRLMIRGAIGSLAWMRSFADVCEEMAAWLQARGVEYLCLGGETLAIEYPPYFEIWDDLITRVRAVYSGKITYNTNWAHTYELLELKKNFVPYARMDYVAVSTYHNIYPYGSTYDPIPTYAEVLEKVEVWPLWDFHNENIAEVTRSIATHHNKPFFAYCGTSSKSNVFSKPALSGTADPGTTVDLNQQDMWIRMLFHFYSDTMGMHFDGSWLTQPNKDPNNKEFTLQRKPAETTIQTNFEALSPITPIPRLPTALEAIFIGLGTILIGI